MQTFSELEAAARAEVAVSPPARLHVTADPSTWPALLRLGDLASTATERGLLPISRITIWRMVRRGEFPRALDLGGVPVWTREAVADAIARLAAEAAAPRTLKKAAASMAKAMPRKQRSARKVGK